MTKRLIPVWEDIETHNKFIAEEHHSSYSTKRNMIFLGWVPKGLSKRLKLIPLYNNFKDKQKVDEWLTR